MKAIENNQMMKNIYIAISSAALCAAVLTGCQKENWFNGRSGDGMLSFEASVSAQRGTPVGTKSGVLSGEGIELPFSCEIRDIDDGVSGIATKGDLINTSLSTGKLSDFWEEFTVNAWNEDGTAFISGAQVNWNDSKSKWATDTPTAWTGVSEKTFYAWTNLPASGATVTNADASTFALTYSAVPTDVKDQTDILMGWYEGNGDADGDGKVDGVASLAFSHPLTSVAFIQGEMEGVAEIRSITLTGVYGSGDCAATYVKGATNVVPTYTWSNFGDGVKVTLGDNESYLDITSEIHMIGEPFILIPQDLSEQPVKLEVIVKTEAGNLAKISGTLSSGAWASGKITFYTIGYAAKPAVEPLCFTAESEQSVTFQYMNLEEVDTKAGIGPQAADAKLYYSYDKESWTEWEDLLSPVTFGTVEHPCVYLKGDNPKGFKNILDPAKISEFDEVEGEFTCFQFGEPEYVTVSGNIMSLLDSSCRTTEFNVGTSAPFAGLFASSPIIDASALELPAKILVPMAYTGMFSGNVYLQKAPELPATSLADDCYLLMFCACMSLTEAPELPALSLAKRCYMLMFSNCSSLETAPEIPATSVAPRCCMKMFDYCNNVKNGPTILPAMTLAESCYENMLADNPLTVAPVLPATTLAKRCYAGMLADTDIVEMPELPATNLADYCYDSMFYYCEEMTTPAEQLPATILKEGCYNEMFRYCSRLKAAPVLPAGTLVKDSYNKMFHNCYELNSITMLATDIAAEGCLDDWVGNVAATGTFVKDHALGTRTSSEDDNARICIDSSNGIPTGWTVAEEFDPAVEPVCITADAEQSVIFIKIKYDYNTEKETLLGASDGNLLYSYDRKLWTEWDNISPLTFGTDGRESIYFVGNNPTGFSNDYDGEDLYLANMFHFMNEDVNVEVSGNIMSLIAYDKILTEFPAGSYSPFLGLFAFTPVTDASGLVLPAKTMVPMAYNSMFAYCSDLVAVPELPATTMATYCYANLFHNCTSLIDAPALPATNLDTFCYWSMFFGCTALVEAPALEATVLAPSCYRAMFNECTALEIAPELEVPTLVDHCYFAMFQNCSSLRYIKMLATDITAEKCLDGWTFDVASAGTFVKDPSMTALPSGTSGIPAGWDVVDAE